jgi:hypothetical protein
MTTTVFMWCFKQCVRKKHFLVCVWLCCSYPRDISFLKNVGVLPSNYISMSIQAPQMIHAVVQEKSNTKVCMLEGLLISMRHIISQKWWSCILPSNYVSMSIHVSQIIQASVQEESSTKICVLEGLLISMKYIIPQKCWSCALPTNYSSMSIHTSQIIQATVQEESSTKIWVLEGLLISMRYSETRLRHPLLRKLPA